MNQGFHHIDQRVSSSEPSGEASWSRHQSWTSPTTDDTRTARALGGANGGREWPGHRPDQVEAPIPILEYGKTRPVVGLRNDTKNSIVLAIWMAYIKTLNLTKLDLPQDYIRHQNGKSWTKAFYPYLKTTITKTWLFTIFILITTRFTLTGWPLFRIRWNAQSLLIVAGSLLGKSFSMRSVKQATSADAVDAIGTCDQHALPAVFTASFGILRRAQI